MSGPAVLQAATLAELVANHARVDPDRIALIFEERTYTYAQLDATIERAADALAARGVAPGDRVALMLPNGLDFIAAYYGTLRLGGVVVPINTMYRSAEVSHILRDSEPAAAVVDATLLGECAGTFEGAELATLAVSGAHSAGKGLLHWDAACAAALPRAPFAPAPSDLAVLIYTSGTTGRAKGAMHSHATLLANVRQGGTMLRRTFGSDDRALTALPLCHIFAMQSGLNQLFRVGGSVVLMARFDALGVLANIERHRCTFLVGAPPMFVRWTAMPELRSFDLSSLRFVTCGAAPLSAAVLHAFADATGVTVSESYGLTEAGPTTHSNSNGPIDKLGSVGPPLPDVQSRVVDADGNDIAPGEPGEIIVRSPGVMLGYWRDPAATADVLRDGWLHTGDVAVVDADGYYTIVDRLKDMISAGGFKIWPREIEETLAEHPAIAEIAVVGIPDADAGERAAAFVVPRPGTTVTEADIIAYARGKLAKFKAPARVFFVEALPRLNTGKVLRRELRDRARALVTAATGA